VTDQTHRERRWWSGTADTDNLGADDSGNVHPSNDNVLGGILVDDGEGLGTGGLGSSRGGAGLDVGDDGVLHDTLGAWSGSGDRSRDDYLHID
jgi:hypothetical protein